MGYETAARAAVTGWKKVVVKMGVASHEVQQLET
jgi:hypothetical protein